MIMNYPLYIRSQSAIADDIAIDLADTTGEIFSSEMIYRSINHAVSMWGTKCNVPHIYSSESLDNLTTTGIQLPTYVHGALRIALRLSATEWAEISSYVLRWGADGYRYLSIPEATSCQEIMIVFFRPNGRVPIMLPQYSTAILQAQQSMSIPYWRHAPSVGFIQIENEWLSYSGISQAGDASETNLLNLRRGLFDTADFDHTTVTADPNVYWGIAVHDPALFEQLIAVASAHLRLIYLRNAPALETEADRWEMQWVSQMAEDYWNGYKPPVAPDIISVGRQ